MVKHPGVEIGLQLSMEFKASVALTGANVRIENPILRAFSQGLGYPQGQSSRGRDVNQRQVNRYRRWGYDGFARKI